MHPGARLSSSSSTNDPNATTASDQEDRPRDFSSMVVRIPDLIRAAAQIDESPSTIYIFDSTNSSGEPEFLGGAMTIANHSSTSDDASKNSTANDRYDPKNNQEHKSMILSIRQYMNETTYSDLVRETSNRRRIITDIDIVSRRWTVVVIAVNSTYQSEHVIFIISTCGAIILLASILLAFWLYANTSRNAKLSQIKSDAEIERAQLLTRTAEAERDLNEFVSHEIRNPLSAALSATSFVKAEVTDERQALVGARRSAVLDDLSIIETSLQFINDLTRTMLDMSRASSRQLTIEMAATDILRDILNPVEALLYQRREENNYTVTTICPEGLVVCTDRLRLKQMVLNLARNAAKFVERGYIRLGASVDETHGGHVQIYVEDSGPGIPHDKQVELFTKFQKSLDSLNQGTGIGLSLCKHLADLLGATLSLDYTYDSGIPGSPGARFIIDLRQPPCVVEEGDEEAVTSATSDEGEEIQHFAVPSAYMNGQQHVPEQAATSAIDEEDDDDDSILPKKLKVLFVDDDLILRKLFRRAVAKCVPDWDISEAANGETVLQWIQQGESFDLIFVDQYMASVEKQLLGTETVRALRSHGVTSILCGLSANDLAAAFQSVGANAFWLKPFPSEPTKLKRALIQIFRQQRLQQQQYTNNNVQTHSTLNGGGDTTAAAAAASRSLSAVMSPRRHGKGNPAGEGPVQPGTTMMTLYSSTEMVRAWCSHGATRAPRAAPCHRPTISPLCPFGSVGGANAFLAQSVADIAPPMPCTHRNICNNDNNANNNVHQHAAWNGGDPTVAAASGSFLISPSRQQRDTRSTNPVAAGPLRSTET
jgi:signal transduction histidine kinase/DNA-binding NarL/FixJ family response regulator